ncbi:Resolvase-like protein [Vibrio crassostreae]|nr:resolvase-like protein [Vibrio crassostreae]CAK2397160.1 Resolvase-like protein [Vibrio crassostreae]CAK3905449.1 Resolvase-like protein [Vibrio crassostreae]
MKIGYVRVSIQDQTLDVQLEQVKAIGYEKFTKSKRGGESPERELLNLLLDFAREGDVIHVTKVDRILIVIPLMLCKLLSS